MEVQINYLAVILAMVISMVVGSIWYARSVFGNAWIKLAKIDMKRDRGSVMKPIAITMVVSLLTAYTLAHVAYMSNQFFHHSFLYDSLNTAFWMWFGFTAARFITHNAFEGRPMKLTAITLGHEFVTFMLMGLVIGLFGV